MNDLNDLHRSLKNLASYLAVLQPIAPADQLKQKMETIIKQVRDKPATEIARDLIEQYSIAYEQYQQKEEEITLQLTALSLWFTIKSN